MANWIGKAIKKPGQLHKDLGVKQGKKIPEAMVRAAAKKKGKVGFERYDDPAYHKAVREAGARLGLKVFSCPGKCGECAGGNHACGSDKFKGVVIVNGVH